MSEIAHTTRVTPSPNARRVRVVAPLIALAIAGSTALIAWPGDDSGTTVTAPSVNVSDAGPATGTPASVSRALSARAPDAGPAAGTPTSVSRAFSARTPDAGPAAGTPAAVSQALAGAR